MAPKTVTGTPRGATPAQLKEAERGFKLWLRRRFSAVWIAENASDLMAQANVEYAEWLEDHQPARNPVGWLLICAERRAKNLLDAEMRRPASRPLDDVFHLADHSTPTPEQEAIRNDRSARLREALEFLPEKECRLLALVYFGDHSIREAGRKLGWQKSAADRHHKWALEKLRALVGEDRALLSPATLGLVAWSIAYAERGRPRLLLDAALSPIRQVVSIGLDGAESVSRQFGELGRRLAPASDQASAAASSGTGRLVGACGVTLATVVCGIAANGVIPAGNEAGIAPAVPAGGATKPAPSLPAPAAELTPAAIPTVEEPEPSATDSTPSSAEGEATTTRERKKTTAPKATTEQTINEFGVEAGAAPSTESSSGSSGGESQAPRSSSGSGSSGSGSSGSQVAQEFGL
ncbi:MAG: sigma-70 family RNA polymerase sigma factor [Solirubrobacterales bacterium]